MPTFGSQYIYKGRAPLYRGIYADQVIISDYAQSRVHYWPCFSSTSKLKSFAIQRSRRGDNEKAAMIFEIYTNAKNEPSTNIELPKSWSFYPSE